MSGTIRTELRERTLEITIARPEKRNALTHAMYEQLIAAFTRADQDDVHVVLVRGEGDHLTAGNDLGDFLDHPPEGESSPVFRFLQALVACEKPLVFAVDGFAIGLGTTMLLHGDWSLATPRARLQLPFVDLGLVPEAASTVLLPLAVGAQRAQRWLLSGEPIAIEEAHAAGLVSEIVAPEALLERSRAVCTRLAAKPPAAMRSTKQLTRAPWKAQVEAALHTEAEILLQRLAAPEARARLQALLKR